MQERKYACDYETFQKLRELYAYVLWDLETLAKWAKWIRKEPQNRVGEEPRHPTTLPFATRSGIANPVCYLNKAGKEDDDIKLKRLAKKLKKPMDGLSKPFFPFANGGDRESFTIDTTALEIICMYRDARRAYGPDEEVPQIDAEEINAFHANFRHQCQALANEGKGFIFDGRWGEGSKKEAVAQSTVPKATELYQ